MVKNINKQHSFPVFSPHLETEAEDEQLISLVGDV